MNTVFLRQGPGPQGTFGDVWGGGAPDVWWVEAGDTAPQHLEPRTSHLREPCSPRRQWSEAEKPDGTE